MKLILHGGYAKTATTYLQEHIFPRLDGIAYLGRNVPDDPNNAYSEWAYDFIRNERFSFQKLVSELPSKVEPMLMSHEVIFRPSHFDVLIKRLGAIQQHVEDVKIIVSIRNQTDLIFSRYIHDVNLGLFKRYELEDALDQAGTSSCTWPVCATFTNKVLRKTPLRIGSCDCNHHKIKRIHMPYYDFMNTRKLLMEEFGNENVHFIVSEELRRAPESELQRLCKFVGASELGAEIMAELKGKSSNVRHSRPDYKHLRSKNEANGVLDKVRSFYSESNRALAEAMNIDLSVHGYYD